MKPYKKYTKRGDIHWRWYLGGNVGYKCQVDESIKDFPSTGTVLDIGCGDGLPAYLLAAKGLRVTGIEPEPDGLEIAKERLKHFDFVALQTTIEDYPNDRRFDYLYSLNTIEHVENPNLYVDIMRNINNFGIVITDNVRTSGSHPHHNIEFSIESLEELFSEFKTERLTFDHPWTQKHFIGLKICSQ